MTIDDDEEATARLLRLAGPRSNAPADRAARVHDRVRQQWRTATRRRAIRRRAATVAAMLTLAAAIALAVRMRPDRGAAVPRPSAGVAEVERIEGALPLSRGAAVRAGEWIETGAAARAALRLTGGTSLRLDSGARARLLSATVIELAEGAVYVDTGSTSAGVEVRTPFGTAHDVGTQFEVRLQDRSLRLRVRSGLVELRRGAQSLSARPGTEVTIAPERTDTRHVAPHGPEWEWAANLAPSFEIDGRPLAAFLEHLSREQGWTVRYADARLARDASGIILHGSVAGLKGPDALAVALRTSGLSHRLVGGELVVFRTLDQK